MVVTTKNSMLAQVLELEHFNILNNEEAHICRERISEWSKHNPNGVGQETD